MENRLSKANDLRESEQYGESSKIYTECLIDLLKENDTVGLIHCLSGQSHIYKILAGLYNHPTYLHLSVSFAKESYNLAENSKDTLDTQTLSIAYSSYGDSLLADGQMKEALTLFEKSLSISPASLPEKGRLKSHIGGIKYALGEKDLGINLLNESLTDIRTGDLSSYSIRVWETGALNGLALVYAKEGDLVKAKKIIDESLSIAVKNNLPIRQKQIEAIKSKITSGNF